MLITTLSNLQLTPHLGKANLSSITNLPPAACHTASTTYKYYPKGSKNRSAAKAAGTRFVIDSATACRAGGNSAINITLSPMTRYAGVVVIFSRFPFFLDAIFAAASAAISSIPALFIPDTSISGPATSKTWRLKLWLCRYGLLTLLLCPAIVLANASPTTSTVTTNTVTPSDSATTAEETFTDCIDKLAVRARNEGVTESLITNDLHTVNYLPRVIELDRKQPEFTSTFAGYFNTRVSQQRIERGRQLLQEYRPLLEELTQRYGIPPQYLLAFWGLETNFGGYLGKMPTLDALATLACDERRSEFFTVELLQALRLLEIPGVNRPMLGSWAGAIGNTQFMPSNYHRFAVDGDNDGKIDLWGSQADALTSAANFLQQLGWQRGLRWGREVTLPTPFDFNLTGLRKPQPLSHWRELGLRKTNGAPLDNLPLEAALIVPAGHTGPAFLVYDNFRVIMNWNRSVFYALSVGHLADRINGAGALQQPPAGDITRFSIEQIKALQVRLNELGFDVGKSDGIMGSATKRAIQNFQSSRQMVADGYPDPEVFDALGIAVGVTPITH